MSRFRMCRWHTANLEECANPDFEIIDADGFRVPRCKTCGRSPPVKELIPKLQDEWPPNPLPEDEEIGKMNLYWPESVFGKGNAVVPSRTSSTQIKRSVQVEVDGRNESFEFVDKQPLDSSQLRLMSLFTTLGEDPVYVSLQTYQDDNIPEYEAVSYSLGGENRNRTPTKPIYINRLWDIILLTDTCVSMLRFLSPQPDERSGLLWFDYLCINQHDMAERDCQLPKMGSIYGVCTRVIVYLGDDIVQRLGPGEHRSRYWLHEIDETLKLSGNPASLTLGDVLNRDYFKRTWIIQEILLAETVIIPIGRCNFRAGLVALNHLQNARQSIWEKEGVPWLQHMGQTTISLYEALRQTWGSNVTDPRDKIFGVLGLVQDDSEFRPNSSLSRLSTFIGTCAHLIKRGYTKVLLKSIGDGTPAGQPTWLPKWTDPNLWETQDISSLRYLDDVREHFDPTEKFWPTEYRYNLLHGRIDIICMLPGKNLPSKLLVLPKFDHLSLCSSTGTLCLRLSHLLTLKTIPVQVAEAGTLKAFNLYTKETRPFFFITTLAGPLETLQLLDEIFLHVDAQNQHGILFALPNQGQNGSRRLLFSCVCIDVLLFTDPGSLRENFRAGVPTSPAADFKDMLISSSSEWFNSPLGRSMSSALRESRNSSTSEYDIFTNPYDRKHLQPFAVTEDITFKFKFYIGEDELWLLSQALLDDDAERDERKKTHFLTAYQKVIQNLNPGCTIRTDNGYLFLSNFTPESILSEDEDDNLILHNPPLPPLISPGPTDGFVRESTTKYRLSRKDWSPWNSPAFPQSGSLSIKKLKISLSLAEEEIRSHGLAYHKLRILTDFRGTNGLNETQLLKQCKEETSENDSVYVDNVWRREESAVKALGLVGKVKDVRIQ